MTQPAAEHREPPWPPRNVRLALIGLGIALMALVCWWLDPGTRSSALDRIFLWTFAVFCVGFAELFVFFIAISILGIIDLPKVFEHKEGPPPKSKPSSVSLSRLQAVFWTIVVLLVFFHAAVTQPDGVIPTLPPELLLVMGISGAVYVAGKHLSVQKGSAAAESETGES